MIRPYNKLARRLVTASVPSVLVRRVGEVQVQVRQCYIALAPQTHVEIVENLTLHYIRWIDMVVVRKLSLPVLFLRIASNAGMAFLEFPAGYPSFHPRQTASIPNHLQLFAYLRIGETPLLRPGDLYLARPLTDGRKRVWQQCQSPHYWRYINAVNPDTASS